MMTRSRDFFTSEQQAQLISAIQEAEKNTSGEIRLHIDTTCDSDVVQRTLEVFDQLKMGETQLKNGVLFYLAIETRDFTIIGDKGIHDLVPENFWDEVKDLVLEHFKQGDFVGGLSEGIKLCGVKLKAHFPYQQDDVNELSDEISFG